MSERLICVRADELSELQRRVAQVRGGARPESFAGGRLALVACGPDTAAVRAQLERATALLPAGGPIRDPAGLFFEPEPWGPRRLAVLFPGQGSQRLGMLQALRGAIPGFDAELGRLDGIWQAHAGRSVLSLVYGERSQTQEDALRDTRNAQPALGLVSAALAAALRELGVEARWTAGHSFGELPALWAGGAFSVEALARLSFERGRLLGEAGERAPGAMLAVRSPVEQLVEWIARLPGTAVLANLNAPSQVVVSGDLEAVAELEKAAREAKVGAVRLRTSAAFHSPLMRPIAERWRQVLEAEPIAAPDRAQVMANATACAYDADPRAVRELLVRQVSEPVRWSELMADLYRQGARIFLEVGPGRVLTDLVAPNLPEAAEHLALPLDPGKAESTSHLLGTVARLLAHAVPVRWQALVPSDPVPEAGAGRGSGALPAPAAAEAPASALTAAALSWTEANRRALEQAFARQAGLVEDARRLPEGERERLLGKIVEASQGLLSDFFATQSEGLRRLLGDTEGLARMERERAAAPTPPGGPAPGAAPADAPGRRAGGEGETQTLQWLREQFARVTGFPLESITAESHFERDLGLDSIGLVELMLALVERFPALETRRDKLRELTCIGDLMKLLRELGALQAAAAPARAGAAAEGSPAPAGEEPSASRRREGEATVTSVRELREELVGRVGRALSIDPEQIGDGADFEDELGLDAFTREELLLQLVARAPTLRLAGRAVLNARTVRGVLELFQSLLPPQPERADDPVLRFVRERVELSIAAGTRLPPRLLLAGVPDEQFARDLGRCRVAVDALRVRPDGWELGGKRVPLEDHEGLAGLLPASAEAPAVLFHAAGELGSWDDELEVASTGLFVLAKALRERFAAAGGGQLGVVGRAGNPSSWTAARGVARALARELPHVRVRSVWIEAGGAPARSLLEVLSAGPSAQDLFLDGAQLRRHQLALRPFGPSAWEGGWKPPRPLHALLLGGGDGITAELGVALAARFGAHVSAVGRTAWTPGAAGPNEAERHRAISRTRERVLAAGGSFSYHRADATEESSLAEAVSGARAAAGPVHLVVHGAGVIEDALLEAKSVPSFRRVVAAKARSIDRLRRLVERDPLEGVYLMSSLTSHVGTAGQTDYSAANEVLNDVAQRWNREASYPVRALLWSVWGESGMAPPALRERMARLGLKGIDNAVGSALFLEELLLGAKCDSWVLLTPRSVLEFSGGSPG